MLQLYVEFFASEKTMKDSVNKPSFTIGDKIPTHEEHHAPRDAKLKMPMSLDSADVSHNKSTECGIRKTVRRRLSKRTEPEYGNNVEEYDKIRQRVLQERAVVNAIDALQERWHQIMFLYEDCVELNEGRQRQRLQKLCIQRQSDMIFVILGFLFICLTYSILLIYMSM